MEELARRAVECKHWRWMPGMLTDDGVRVLEFENASVWAEPDLTDPATLGCLWAIVRRRYCHKATLVFEIGGARCTLVTVFHEYISHGESEAEALVAALEVAG